jgi:hypothetical protein
MGRMKISAVENVRIETKSYRRRRVMKLSAFGVGAHQRLARQEKARNGNKRFFRTAPNELNYALPWLLMGQIKKNL